MVQVELRPCPLAFDRASAIQSILARCKCQDFIFTKFNLFTAEAEQLPTFPPVAPQVIHAIIILAMV